MDDLGEMDVDDGNNGYEPTEERDVENLNEQQYPHVAPIVVWCLGCFVLV